ncbi:MAG: hypothetical protein U0802_08380 [Candidatus Binatia bacterium]
MDQSASILEERTEERAVESRAPGGRRSPEKRPIKALSTLKPPVRRRVVRLDPRGGGADVEQTRGVGLRAAVEGNKPDRHLHELRRRTTKVLTAGRDIDATPGEPK